MNKQQKGIIEDYITSYNNLNIEGMVKNLDTNVVFENVTDGEVDLKIEGLEEFRKQAESTKQYFAERNQTIESWKFDGDKVTIGISYKAVLAIDLSEGLKKGDTLELVGQSVFQFEDGKIRRITDLS